jgi:ribose-phosphate pyrophosphokinase
MFSDSKLKVFSGNSNVALAEEIAKHLKTKLGGAEVGEFSDGEPRIEIQESVRGADVFMVQSICTPANNNIMELLVFIDALKRASAQRITAVIPYYGFGRQDHMMGREPISAKLVANFIAQAGANHVLAVDLHSPQIQGFFDIPCDNLTAMKLFADYLKEKKLGEIVVVSPDVGGVKRARNFSRMLEAQLAVIDKNRPKPNVAEVMNVIGDVEGKTAVLVDDLIDTGGTVVNGAEALLEKGAEKVYACVTHGVLSGGAPEKIDESKLAELVITNSIPLKEQGKKIKVLSLAPLLAEAMKRIHLGESVSQLFV